MFSPSQISLSSSLTSFPMNHTVPPSGDRDKELDFLVNAKQSVHPTALDAILLMKVRHLLSSEMSQVISATLIFGPALIK